MLSEEAEPNCDVLDNKANNNNKYEANQWWRKTNTDKHVFVKDDFVYQKFHRC